MTFYADASVIVSVFAAETGSGTARAWLGSLAAGELVSSAWCVTEVASALSGKARRSEILRDDERRYFAAARDLLTRSAIGIGVEERHFRSAADLLRRSARPLRASDALHLAIAAAAGAQPVTLDRRMAEAGQALGLDVELLR